MMTIKELYDIIKKQQEEIDDLRDYLTRLQEWSDLNDYFLREMIDALTESVDALTDNHCCCEVYRKRHEKYTEEKKAEREREALELELVNHCE